MWLTHQGYAVFKPLFHSPNYDLVADLGHRMVRIEVKSTTQFRHGRWCVAVRTCGGNQSWNGVTKKLHAGRCDFLFVTVGDGRRWFIPAAHFGGGTALMLGGPKYAAFEVEHGDPIPELHASGAPLQSSSP